MKVFDYRFSPASIKLFQLILSIRIVHYWKVVWSFWGLRLVEYSIQVKLSENNFCIGPQ